MRSPFVLIPLVLVAGAISLTGCQFTAQGQNADGLKQFQSGNYQGAAAHFQQALQLNPRNADAHYNLAALYHSYGEKQRDPNQFTYAETYYKQALTLNPSHTEAYRGYAVLLGETNRSTQAFELLKGWAAGNAKSADARVELARFYQEHGDKQTAEVYLQQALVVDPQSSRAWAAIGKLREDAGDQSQALASYQKAYQLNPNQPGLAERVASLTRVYNPSPLTVPTAAPSGTRVVDATGPMRRF